jgi:putative membrane protein
MMRFLARVLLTGLAIFLISTLMPGVEVQNMNYALLVALILTLLNVFIKPIFVLLTLPITMVTLGFFLLVINALIVMLASKIVPGFIISGFWVALFFSIVLSMTTSLLDAILGPEKRSSGSEFD